MRGLRILLGAALALLVGVPTSAFSQTQDLFASLKVDVSLVVYKHPTGADMVTITVLAPDFPVDELRQRATEIGQALGTPCRGLVVFSEGNGAQATGTSPFIKATFATNGILNGAGGIRLQPIVRAFAGGTGPSLVGGIEIHCEGVKALADTLLTYDSPAVQVQGRSVPSPASLEYRVRLKSQAPNEIDIPDRVSAPSAPEAAGAPSTSPSMTLVWTLVVIGALAAGALVYNLALRKPTRTRR